MEHLALIGSRWCSQSWSTRTSQEVALSSTTPAQACLTIEFPPWLNSLFLQPHLQNLHQVLYLMNHSLEFPLSSWIDKYRITSTASQIVILLSGFNCVFFESTSLTHISWVVIQHESISHKNKWNTYHALDLGDAHICEALRLPGRSPIPILL